MLELVRYFNEHYGQEYENIEYPTTKKEIYQTYQVVKSYGIKDDRLVELLNNIVLPKPETIKEKENKEELLWKGIFSRSCSRRNSCKVRYGSLRP